MGTPINLQPQERSFPSQGGREETKKRNRWVVYSSPEEFTELCERSMKGLTKGIEVIKWEREQFKK